jgi:hypothetical protein
MRPVVVVGDFPEDMMRLYLICRSADHAAVSISVSDVTAPQGKTPSLGAAGVQCSYEFQLVACEVIEGRAVNGYCDDIFGCFWKIARRVCNSC